MLAAVLYSPNDLRVEEVPDPICKQDEVLLEIKAVGLCGSDIRTIKSGLGRLKYPQILGHEITGKVVEVGEKVKKYKKGDRLYVSPLVPCMDCPACKRGWLGQCENIIVPGTDIPGGFAEYMAIPNVMLEKGNIISIPENLSYEEAVMTEPLSSVYASQCYSNVTLDDIVVVIGSGPIGCMHMQMAKLRGAGKVIAIEKSESRLKMAENYGADVLINSADQDPVIKVKDITDGWGADKVIVACPSTEAQKQAILMTCKRGTVVFFGGVPQGKLTDIDTNIIHYNQLTILGHYGYNHLENSKAFNLIASGRFPAKKYITHILPLKDISKGVEMAQKGEAIKVVLKP